MDKTFTLKEYREYLRSQKDICLKCDLFEDKSTHGSKIIMLFAEIFAFLVDIYGIEKTTNLIRQYSNSEQFKHWFWRIKYFLGEFFGCDPSFEHIGKWVGKGLFLKISISVIIFHKLNIEAKVIKQLIEKQKNLLEELKKEDINFYTRIIHNSNDHYYLLNERVVISYDNEYFYFDNIIR